MNTPATSSHRTRPIPATDWKYGYASKGGAKTRIIVTQKDKEGISWVHEYKPISNTKYLCYGCFKDKRTKNYGEFIDNIFYAPFLHPCNKISVQKNAEEQKKREAIFLKAQENAAALDFATSSTSPLEITTEVENGNSNLINKASSSSIIIQSPSDVVTTTPKRKCATSTSKKSANNHSSPSLKVLHSTPRIEKPTNFFNKDYSNLQKTPTRSRPKLNTSETPKALKEQQSSKAGDKENKSPAATTKPGAEAKNRKIKRIAIEDDVELILADDEDGRHEDSVPINSDDTLGNAAEATVPQPSQSVENEKSATITDNQTLDQSNDENDSITDESSNDKSETNNTIQTGRSATATTISTPRLSTPMPAASPRLSTPMPSTFTASFSNGAREVDTCDAEYGYNEYGKLKGRLIVREPDNRKYAREYAVTDAAKNWKCLNCKIGIAKKNENGNFFVSTNHECQTIPYTEIKRDQNIFEAKYRVSLMKKTSPISTKKPTMLEPFDCSDSDIEDVVKPKRRRILLLSDDSDYHDKSLQSSPKSLKLQKIPSSQWEWGCDSIGNEKMRIIVFDKNDKNQVHEYRNGGKKLLCLGCNSKNGKYIWALRNDDTENPTISIPPPEKHVCKPRSLKEVREQQRTFEKKGRKRERIVDDNYESEVEGPQEIKRTRKSAQIATEKLTNCFKDCDNIVTENDESNIEEPENNKRILRSARFNDSKFKSVASDDADGEEKSGVSKRPRRSAQIATERLSKTFNFWSEKEVGGEEVPQRHTRFNSSSGDDLDSQKSDDSDDNSSESESDDNNEVERSPTHEQDEDINPSVIEQDIDSPISPFPLKPVEDELMEEKKVGDTVYFSTTQILPSTLSTTVRFFNPSAYELEKCCKKVELQYLSEAYTFWSNTVIKEITPKSVPNKIFPVGNDSSGFACFSLFLTGTEINASKINVTFNQKYFIKNLIEIGKFFDEDLSQLNDKTIEILCSNFLTKYHLQALCHFFECRIGIFAEEKWERYGSWNDETANILTFLMKKDTNNFYPILSLIQQ